MKSLRDRLPDVSVLRHELLRVLESNLPDFLQATHARREELIGNRRYFFFVALFAVAVFASLFFIKDVYGGFFANFMIGSVMLWSAAVILIGREWLTNNQLLAREMNMALVPMLTNTLDRMLIYTHNDEDRGKTVSQLAESHLLDTADIEVVSDDVYTVYGEREVFIRELVVTPTADRNMTWKRDIFKGLFVVTDWPHNPDVETYISTDGGKSSFSHEQFWPQVINKPAVYEMPTEDTDLEKRLHMATTDIEAAKEILTQDFLHDIYQWWNSHQLNMRISIKGGKMYIMLPEASVRIATSTTSTKPEAIEKYAWALVNPIWHSLRIIESATRR